MMWPWWWHYNVIIQVDLAQNEYKHKIICSGIFHIPSSFMTLINSSAFPSPPIWRLYSVGHYAAPEETCRYVLISRQEGLVECALWCWRATSTVIAAHARCTLSSASTRAILFISSLLNTRGSHLFAKVGCSRVVWKLEGSGKGALSLLSRGRNHVLKDEGTTSPSTLLIPLPFHSSLFMSPCLPCCCAPASQWGLGAE